MRLLDSISISDYSRLSEALGDGLRVIDARINTQEAAIIHEHVAGLLAVPAGVLSKLRSHGLARIQIGKGGVAGFPGFEEYQGIQIPTAPRGVTWDDARGAYIAGRREVILGTGRHGYSGTATHEVGHALGHLLSYDLSEILQREYKAQLNGIFGKNSAYYPNRRLSATGCKEFFAETVGLGILSPDALRANFSHDYYEFIMKVTLRT
ncbi:MAG: hypothetical protein JNK74_06340 [Candidatus Hydrogenedentes bacterium]|nr:hypothetical protein [Candidatus Hydrogenedentota bacterium]